MNHKTYDVILETTVRYYGSIEASSEAEAIAEAERLWHHACPHPFKQDDPELLTIHVQQPKEIS